MDKSTNPFGEDSDLHFKPLCVFKDIAAAGMKVNEACLSCDCHVVQRKEA